MDVIDTITPDSRRAAGRTARRRPSTETPGTRLNQLFYNFRKPAGHPLADARVREALSYAIDGESLIKDVLIGPVSAAEGVVPASLAGCAKTGTYIYDPARPRQCSTTAGRHRPQAEDHLGDRRVRLRHLRAWRPCRDVRRRRRQAPSCSSSNPAATSWPGARASGGDWDLLGNGFSSPTGLAITMMQGMYAGTAEKEKTRDTYHGLRRPRDRRTLDPGASAEADPAERDAAARRGAAGRSGTPGRALWAFVAQVGARPPGARPGPRAGPHQLLRPRRRPAGGLSHADATSSSGSDRAC